MRLSILYVGPRDGTCQQRARALEDLGHRIIHIPSAIPPLSSWRYSLYRILNGIRRAPDLFGANRRIRAIARSGGIDLVWVDKGLAIKPGTLRFLRAALPQAPLVSYSPDDMANPANQSPAYLASIPLYDFHVTTKSYNCSELRELGARQVIFVDNAYDPATHRPLRLDEQTRRRFGAEVGFVGYYEQERAEMMVRLAKAGVPVTIRGPAWKRVASQPPNLIVEEVFLKDRDYVTAINATRINLGFLRKINRDLQTTRSVEIPGCGAFLLGERTDEHLRLFREGVEAEFFGDFDELLDKCRYYLDHEEERRRIADAGLRRCIQGGYSNQARLAGVLEKIFSPRPGPRERSVEAEGR